jgi:glycerol-3-phosphate dehydrogenase subunit B
MTKYDTVVIGAGTAGLTTACHLAQSGQKVLVVAKGIGALLLASGSIDVLGFHPADSLTPVKNPAEKLDDFLADRPDHPYNLVGKETLKTGIDQFLQLVNQAWHGRRSPHLPGPRLDGQGRSQHRRKHVDCRFQ